MSTEFEDQHHLVNDEFNDIIEYESEGYSDDELDGNKNSDRNLIKRGITRLSKFRIAYGKPGGLKLPVTFDAMHRISGPNRALFSSFLGDLVREHIGLKILSWKKVGSESRDKLWDEITRYFDVDETVRKLVMHRLGGLLRNFRRKLRQTYILPNQNTPSKLNEVPTKYSAIVKESEWVAFINHTTTEEYQGKSAATKMARSKCVYHHTMGRGGYVHVKEKMLVGNLHEKSNGLAPSENEMDTTEYKCSLWHIKRSAIIAKGTVYKSDGKQMLHGKRLPNDCYKVSIDESLVDAACLPDVQNNPFKTVKDALGTFVAWPKNQVVFHKEKVTPPTSITNVVENKTAPKLQKKRKFVSRDSVLKQARANLKSQKSLY